MSANTLHVGITPPDRMLVGSVEDRHRIAEEIAVAGLDSLFYSDHVSFRGGGGMDGLLMMAGLSQLHPTLEVQVGVYLLPLRHPVPVARALASFASLAPGRLIFGVGVGGEDRHEMEVCGIDPRTRGRRCDEQLTILRRLATGEELTHHGEFYDIERCRILPAPDPVIPILIGGRSDAAVRRAGRFGEGWLGSWVSARRWAQAVALAGETAEEAGRGEVEWRHGIQLWVGLDAGDREAARQRVAEGMESFYRIPFAQFERYTPSGTPADVAEALIPYVDAGLRHLNLTPCAASSAEAVALTAEVKRLLVAHLG